MTDVCLRHSKKKNSDTRHKASWSVVFRGIRGFAETALRIRTIILSKSDQQSVVTKRSVVKAIFKEKKLHFEIFSLDKFKFCVKNNEETK